MYWKTVVNQCGLIHTNKCVFNLRILFWLQSIWNSLFKLYNKYLSELGQVSNFETPITLQIMIIWKKKNLFKIELRKTISFRLPGLTCIYKNCWSYNSIQKKMIIIEFHTRSVSRKSLSYNSIQKMPHQFFPQFLVTVSSWNKVFSRKKQHA